jgi:hypothetical protein
VRTYPYAIKAKPTAYHGVQMASRLEAHIAEWMDYGRLKWKYEPSIFRYEEGMYIPDFRVGERTYIEVKPWLDDREARHQLIDDFATKVRVLFNSLEEPFCWLVYSNGFGLLLHGKDSWDWIRGWVGLCCSGHLTVVSVWENADGRTPSDRCRTCDDNIAWLKDWK